MVPMRNYGATEIQHLCTVMHMPRRCLSACIALHCTPYAPPSPCTLVAFGQLALHSGPRLMYTLALSVPANPPVALSIPRVPHLASLSRSSNCTNFFELRDAVGHPGVGVVEAAIWHRP